MQKLLDKRDILWYNTVVRGYGGIGRRAGFRIRWVTVQVRPLLPVPNSRNPNLVPVGDGFGFLFVFGSS